MEWVIRFNRSRVLATLTILLSTVLSLAAAELAVRLTGVVPRMDRIHLHDPGAPGSATFAVDCYPRMGEVHMPIDLATAEGRDAFLKAFPHEVMGSSDLDGADSPELSVFRGPVASSAAVELLAGEVPLCNLLELANDSPRHLVTPPGFGETIGILGDSFAYGQGITSAQTISSRLAERLHARVRSYAQTGADIKEIREQFRLALADQAALHFSKILYFYVLNDAYATPDMIKRLDYLVDFMNVRLKKVGERSETLQALSEHSMLFRFGLFLYTRLVVSQGTVEWYRDLNDPTKNEGVTATFDAIRVMSEEARRRGIEFVVMLYPLMLDMKHYPLADTHAILRDLAKMRGIEFHDLLPAVQAHAEGRTLTVHPVDFHPTAYVQSVVAEDVAAYLKGRPPTR